MKQWGVDWWEGNQIRVRAKKKDQKNGGFCFLFFFRRVVLFLAWGREYFNGYSEEVSRDSLSICRTQREPRKEENDRQQLLQPRKHAQTHTDTYKGFQYICVF